MLGKKALLGMTLDKINVATAMESCEELVPGYSITHEKLEAARETVSIKLKPACLSKDGVEAMVDVSILSGFANFLKAINEPNDK